MSVASPAWVSGYIGLPYLAYGRTRDGLDCWGLLTLAYRESLGVSLPTYDGVGLPNRSLRHVVGDLMAANRDGDGWTPVQAGDELPWDGILLRVSGVPVHVGIVIGDGEMLHCIEGADSCIESYRASPTWCNRVVGFFRHAH